MFRKLKKLPVFVTKVDSSWDEAQTHAKASVSHTKNKNDFNFFYHYQ